MRVWSVHGRLRWKRADASPDELPVLPSRPMAWDPAGQPGLRQPGSVAGCAARAPCPVAWIPRLPSPTAVLPSPFTVLRSLHLVHICARLVLTDTLYRHQNEFGRAKTRIKA